MGVSIMLFDYQEQHQLRGPRASQYIVERRNVTYQTEYTESGPLVGGRHRFK